MTSMDMNFAVFNGHKNNASAIARRWMRINRPEWNARLNEIERAQGGIMGIFNQPPEPSTMAFAGMVQHIVNRDPKSK